MSMSTEFRICCISVFFFQAEDGIRDLVRSRGLGDVYKRQAPLHRCRTWAGARSNDDPEQGAGTVE